MTPGRSPHRYSTFSRASRSPLVHFARDSERLSLCAQELLYQVRSFRESFHVDRQAVLNAGELIDCAIENIHFESVATDENPRRADRRNLNCIADQGLELPPLLSCLDRGNLLVRVETAQGN